MVLGGAPFLVVVFLLPWFLMMAVVALLPRGDEVPSVILGVPPSVVLDDGGGRAPSSR